MTTTPPKFWLGLYLFITGILAINIHIQMQNAGVPYPEWQPTQWMEALIFSIQCLGIVWLSHQILLWKPLINRCQHIGIIFITMAAIQELFVRLPMTAGYTVDQKFFFLWILNYLPELLVTLVSTITLTTLQRKLIPRSVMTTITLTIVLSLVIFFWVTPLLKESTLPLLSYLTQPSEHGILTAPYPAIVDIIASITFIEPMLASFFICYLICTNGKGIFKALLFKTTAALLVLTQSGPKFILYMSFSSIENLTIRLLSVSQFTLEWVFAALAVSIAVIYVTSRDRI